MRELAQGWETGLQDARCDPAVLPGSGVFVMARFEAPAHDVFAAWLEPSTAARWLFATATRPMTQVRIDARVDGEFRLVDRCGGLAIAYHGRYVAVERPGRLVFDLATGGPALPPTRVTVEITPRPPGCTLTLLHAGVAQTRADDVEARWTGMLYGLGHTLLSSERESFHEMEMR